jgi:hypothetical protein
VTRDNKARWLPATLACVAVAASLGLPRLHAQTPLLFGTDTVAPAGPEPYFAVFDLWAPVWRLLTPDASLAVRKGNYQRLFDEGRRKVRAWEATNAR